MWNNHFRKGKQEKWCLPDSVPCIPQEVLPMLVTRQACQSIPV